MSKVILIPRTMRTSFANGRSSNTPRKMARLFCMKSGGVRFTKRLGPIEWLCEHTVVGFNLAFDWFHIVKTYTIFRLADPDWIPCEHIEEIALLEPRGTGWAVRKAGERS